MHHLNVDLETYSSAPLDEVGAQKYVESNDFEILLFAFSLDGGPVQVIDMACGEIPPVWLIAALRDPDFIKHAYNANFEWLCLSKWYGLLPPEQWRCTLFHGLYAGFPGSLQAAGAAMGLTEDKQKLTVGKSLITYFCKPCAPTKKNGGRTRNLPKHDPEKWELFKTYNAQDVVAEMEIERLLSKIPVPPWLQQQWVTNVKVNYRGVALDCDLVAGALNIMAEEQAALMDEAQKLTGLENPNSIAQVTAWINRIQPPNDQIPGLTKEIVADWLQRDGLHPAVRRMLEIRQELGKTSTKKYDKMAATVCKDGRVHGMMQFYKANRSGRWAGELVQLQNLPRTYLEFESIGDVRQLVKRDQREALAMLYGSVSDTLSQLIRTALVAAPGHVLIDADFSAIEARVLAWTAGEDWALNEFRGDGLIYEATAANMFHVDKQDVKKGGKHADLRSKGKVATLACIAEGQLVLTNRGPVPIEEVQRSDLLWDGVEWVQHDGVVYRGMKEVITFDGLTATYDHKVYVKGQNWPVWFGDAASSGAHLLQAGDGGRPIWVGEDHKSGETLVQKLESLYGPHTMSGLRADTVDEPFEPYSGAIEGLPELLKTCADVPEVAVQESNGGKAALHKSRLSRISELQLQGNQVRVQDSEGNVCMDTGESRGTAKGNGDRPDRQQQGICTGKSEMGGPRDQQPKQANIRFDGMEPEGLAVLAKRHTPHDGSRNDSGRDPRSSEDSGSGETQELEGDSKKVRVFDILNAGPRHRFTVSGKLVHNCGYGGGVSAMVAMGALSSGIPEEELPGIVQQWRNANPKIVKLWHTVEDAAIEVIQNGGGINVFSKTTDPATHNKYRFTIAREYNDQLNIPFMTILLPSGRKLYYASPRIGSNRWGGPSIVYTGQDQTTKKWCEIETYGAKIVENIIQGIARDCLGYVIDKLVSHGLQIVFHIHDEVVIDAKPWADSDTMLKDVVRLMTLPIPWAPGLPLNADGWTGQFFRKD